MLESNDRLNWAIPAIFALIFTVVIVVLVPAKEAACRDGWNSPSIGRQGACPHHGGVDRSLGLGGWLLLFGMPLAGWAGHTSIRVVNSGRARIEAVKRQARFDALDAELDRRKRNAEHLMRSDCPKCAKPITVEVLRRGVDAGEVTLRCSDWMRCSYHKVLMAGVDFDISES